MSGRVEVPIGRDPRDRKRMAAIMNVKGGPRARSAASRWISIALSLKIDLLEE
jgi:hypothetical protein